MVREVLDPIQDDETVPILQSNVNSSGHVLESGASVNLATTAMASRRKGLTILTVSVFIIGEMAGSGVLNLPSAIEDAGWMGLIILVVSCIVSGYTGYLLGESWLIVRQRYQKFRMEHTRNPYPTMGEITFGKVGRYAVSFCINCTLFGVATVFLLLSSDNISNLLSKVDTNISFCYWCLICASVLTPFTLLGRPKDFWGFALGAALCTAVACVIVFINIMIDRPSVSTHVSHSTITFVSFFTSFGAICFSFGGHAAFPTFHADMRHPQDFGKAVAICYACILLMYFPISASGYFIYGETVKSNILNSLSDGPMKITTQIIFTGHLLCAFVIVLNPFCQELEHVVRIPQHFTYKRILTRVPIVLCVVFVAETIPHFGAILSLIGGSTVNMLTYVFPSLIYLKLCRMIPTPYDNWRSIEVPWHTKAANYGIVIVGLLSAGASTYSAISDITTGGFSVPCYVNSSAASL